ncbi:SusD/RagB family nutrient-binding outer membrane lipoprotein [Chryseolinea sp. T2]|uniref:SusD/RagB family nutrient-binding outer membrane lipoprotein n=1 Tax=Chryseolinea sp. T2 TaxID=3129255 RepID=UPI0030775ADC
MKRLIIFILPIVLMTACVENLDNWNVDQKKATSVPPRTLFTNALKGIIDVVTTPNVNTNNFRMFVQYWATTTYLDEPRYNMTQRLYSQNQWYAAYRDALVDLKEAKELINEDATLAPDLKANQLALVEIAEVYCWNFLVNTFGDVPYTEALDPNNVLPVYDNAATIYADLLTRLDAAIGMLNTNAGTFTNGNDVIYGGSAAKWKLFANSLKLRMGMLLADVDAAKSRSVVEAAIAGGGSSLILLSSDNAKFPYISAPPNNNPVSANLNPLFSSREDFVMANTIIDKMNDRFDPRRKFFFTKVDDGDPNLDKDYKGGNYGFSNAYADFSHVSAKIIEPTFEALFIDASEVSFYLAEAKERGYNVPAMTFGPAPGRTLSTAQDFYNYGIETSILYWGGTASEVTTYLAQDLVNYTNDKSGLTWQEKIGTQKWISLNNRGWESWTEWRRLDFPKLSPPSGPSIPTALTIPTRMIYPVIEQTVNGDQWTTAAGRYNSDSPAAKLFWDTK